MSITCTALLAVFGAVKILFQVADFALEFVKQPGVAQSLLDELALVSGLQLAELARCMSIGSVAIPRILALFNAADVQWQIDYCCRVHAS
ncbi:hypothetical protein [Pseudomonas sp. EL_65y_Pfl1_R32]|uniref:hypothetical protein n=1 Tax=unclassified Pseudomonas TaxID=196821 RepID=UPI00351A9D30